MRRILAIGAAAVLSLALVSAVQAGHGGGGHGGHGGGGHHGGLGGHHGGFGGHHGGHHGARRPGARQQASARSGKWGHSWRSRYFDRRYGCNVYCCADDGCWYYWCPPDDCYYPVDYTPYGTYAWDDDQGE
jgi:hypothetical protein